MANRSISPLTRKEDVRDKNEVASITVQFELDQIKQHFYDGMTDIQKQFDVADQLLSGDKPDEAKDVWRSQVVFIEGILDFYLHELSKYALVKMFTGKWQKSNDYSSFKIPMNIVEECLKNPESTMELFESLNTRFSSETYLSPKRIGQQLSLIGMSLDDICKKAFPVVNGQTHVAGQAQLRALYDRRNQIAHQADRKHSTAEKEDIDQAFVQNAISTVAKFIDAVHVEALAKEE